MENISKYSLSIEQIAEREAKISPERIAKIKEEARKKASNFRKIREDYRCKISLELLRKPFERVK